MAEREEHPSKPANNCDYVFKILLLGDSGVDKTALLCDPKNPIKTIGVDFKIKIIELDGTKIKLTIWDIAGGERFRALTSAYYKGAKGCVIVYDITNKRSFDNVKEWIGQIEEYASAGVQILLVGTNCHMEDKRQVTTERGEQLATEHRTKFMEVSAETGHNVEECFIALARDIKRQIESSQEV